MAIIKNYRKYINSIFDDDPTEAVGINGFKAFVRIKEKYSYESAVPNTYLEDGSFINEHIIRQPKILTIEGNVSDIYLQQSTAINQARRLEEGIGTISQYLPNRTTAQANKIAGIVASVSNAVDAVDAAINNATHLSEYLGLTNKTQVSNGQKFIDDMNSLYASDDLISIDMPYKTFENMKITLLEVSKTNEDKAINFTLEAQEVRYTDTISVEVAPKPSSELEGSTEGVTDKGVQEGEDPEQSSISTFANWFTR